MLKYLLLSTAVAGTFNLQKAHTSYYLLILASSVILMVTITSTDFVAYGQQSQAENKETPIILTAVSVGNRTQNAFEAKITWTPADIGQPNKFHIEIFDANQLEPRSRLPVNLEIKIYQGDRYLSPAEPTGNEAVQNADYSQDYTFVFPEQGSYTLAIEEIENEGENIMIPIQVTPEFPLSIFAVMVVLFVSIIGLTRLSSVQSIFSE